MPSKWSLAVLLSPLLACPSANGAAMETCGDQANCTTWTVEHVAAPACANANGCQFRVCLTLHQGGSCPWSESTISHTCKKTSTTCPASPPNDFDGAFETKGGWALGEVQCQVGAGGTPLQFLLKDGQKCGNGVPMPGLLLGDVFQTQASCAPRPSSIESCTGNGVEVECIWTVTLPDCTCQPGYHFDTTGGCVKDCFCPFGQSDQSQCPTAIAGTQLCTSCDAGYDLKIEDGACHVRTCLCDLGTPTTGTACAVAGEKDCASCGDEFEMVPLAGGTRHYCQATTTPMVNQCECIEGQAASGNDCPVAGEQVCASCNSGFEMIPPSKICTKMPVANKCQCTNGDPVSSDLCTATGAEECSSCTPPFELLPDRTCKEPYDCSGASAVWTVEMTAWCCEKKNVGCPPNECSCLNGIAASGDKCLVDGGVLCVSCKDGYALVNGKCLPKCTCTNGEPAMGAKCPGVGDHVCDNCHEGFDLTFTGFCKAVNRPTVCHCPGGTAVEDANCPGADMIVCLSCGDGYVLNGGKCDPKEICECTGGAVVADNKCPVGGGEFCESCDATHFLDGTTCKENECQCAGGIAATGAACDLHGKVVCTSCGVGYDFDATTKTCTATNTPNVCTCTNGYPVDSVSCPVHGMELCGSCKEDYELNPGTKACKKKILGGGGGVMNVCKCLFGKGATGDKCQTAGAYVCESCDAGFDLIEHKCVPGSVNGGDKTGTCTGGKAATDARCFLSEGEVCTGCNPGFEFHPFKPGCSIGLCKRNLLDLNVCKCSGGTSAVGDACPATGAEACIDCNEGFQFIKANAADAYGTCEKKKNVCRCWGGTPAMGDRCPIRGMKACIECSFGYDFMPWPGANPNNLGCCKEREFEEPAEWPIDPVDPGSVESMPAGGNIAGAAANALGGSALPKQLEAKSATMFGSFFIACFAGTFFAVGLFLGVRTMKREQWYPKDSATLLPKMQLDMDSDNEVA